MPDDATEAPGQRIGLIVGEREREAFAEILARERFPFTSFDCLRAAIDGPAEPSAIVVWLEDAVSSVLEVVEPLKRRFEMAPVVLACPDIERWEVRAALAAGVAGVIVREDLDSGLVPCLRAVLAGQICVPHEHWRQIEPRALSTREKQVLGLVAMGYMNSQIAERLFLAESTVKSHLSSAFGKLGVRSRHEAAELIASGKGGLGVGITGLVGESLLGSAAEVGG